MVGGLIMILLGGVFILFISWHSSDTSGKSQMLNSVGLDFSESARLKSEEKDKIHRANIQINCARGWVHEDLYPNKIEYWKAVRKVISDPYRTAFDDYSSHFEFGDNREIEKLCLEIIDKKIQKLMKQTK